MINKIKTISDRHKTLLIKSVLRININGIEFEKPYSVRYIDSNKLERYLCKDAASMHTIYRADAIVESTNSMYEIKVSIDDMKKQIPKIKYQVNHFKRVFIVIPYYLFHNNKEQVIDVMNEMKKEANSFVKGNSRKLSLLIVDISVSPYSGYNADGIWWKTPIGDMYNEFFKQYCRNNKAMSLVDKDYNLINKEFNKIIW